jgi:hypothetical protein
LSASSHPIASLVLGFMTVAAAAGESTSVYTDLDIKRCKTIAQSEEEGGYYEGICPGYGGIPVYFAEGDLRQFVAFGKNGKKTCAAMQTFGHFNNTGGKIEWRLDGGKPFATILRWFENGEEVKRQWLVVTRLGESDAQCHTAYIDGAYPNANSVAREIADRSARKFNCKKDNIVVIAKPAITAGEVATGEQCPDDLQRQ